MAKKNKKTKKIENTEVLGQESVLKSTKNKKAKEELNTIIIDPKDSEWKLKMRVNYKACLRTKEVIKPQNKEQEEYLAFLKKNYADKIAKREEKRKRKLEIAKKQKAKALNKTIPTRSPKAKALTETEVKEVKARIEKTEAEKKARDAKFDALRKERKKNMMKRTVKSVHHKEVVINKKNDTEGKTRTPRKEKKAIKKTLCVAPLVTPEKVIKAKNNAKKSTKANKAVDKKISLAHTRENRFNKKLIEKLKQKNKQKECNQIHAEAEKRRLAKKLAVSKKYSTKRSYPISKNENNIYTIRLLYSDKSKPEATLNPERQTLKELKKRLDLIHNVQIKEYKGNDYIGAEAYLANDANKKTVMSIYIKNEKAA